jgi:hypothetical protein
MKLTVSDVARITGLSISTVRQYSWRMRIGTKVGNKKFFTNAEAKRLGSGKLPKPVKSAKTRKPAPKRPVRRGKRR